VPISDRFACELGSDRWLGRTRYNPLEMARLDVKVDLQIKPSAFEMFPGTLSVSKADQQHTVKCAAIASIKFQICFSNTLRVIQSVSWRLTAIQKSLAQNRAFVRRHLYR
jgi:hypothetical protein